MGPICADRLGRSFGSVWSAACPATAMIEVGIARNMGQAMLGTATALTRAMASGCSRPSGHQCLNCRGIWDDGLAACMMRSSGGGQHIEALGFNQPPPQRKPINEEGAVPASPPPMSMSEGATSSDSQGAYRYCVAFTDMPVKALPCLSAQGTHPQHQAWSSHCEAACVRPHRERV